MKQLSQEEITFIDNYLQKSDLVFVDIRAELTDHIASAIEEKMEAENLGFYDAFKDFMVNNKKQLLKSKDYFTPAVLNFAKTLYKPYNLVIGVLIIMSCYFISQFSVSNVVFKKVYFFLFGSVILLSLLQFIYTFLVLRKRFMYLEKLSFSLTGIYYLNIFFNGFFTDFLGSMTSVAVLAFMSITYSIYWFSTLRKFRKKYRYVS